MALSVRVDHGTATLLLASPDTLNALDDTLTTSAIDALEGLRADGSVHAIILRAEGRAFSAGGDLGMLAGMADEASSTQGSAALVDRMRSNARLVELLQSAPQLTIAAVQGACVGAALGWIAACDLRVASTDAVFSSAFLSLGLPTDFGTTHLLSRIVGPARAADIILRPRRILAAEAAALGLVNEVVDPAELERAALAWAAVGSASSDAVAAVKENLRDAVELPLAQSLDREAERFVHVLGRDSVGTAVRAAAARAEKARR